MSSSFAKGEICISVSHCCHWENFEGEKRVGLFLLYFKIGFFLGRILNVSNGGEGRMADIPGGVGDRTGQRSEL